MSAKQNIDIVQRAIEALRTDGLNGFVSFFSDDAVFHSPAHAEPVIGRKAIQSDMEEAASVFADMRYEDVQIFGSDDRICVQGFSAATHIGLMYFGPDDILPAVPRPIRIHVCIVIKMKNGEIIEYHEYFDKQEIWSQTHAK